MELDARPEHTASLTAERTTHYVVAIWRTAKADPVTVNCTVG